MDAIVNLLYWFTKPENAKVFVLLLLFVTFVGLLIYVFTGKKRSQAIEDHKYVIFQEDDTETGNSRKEERNNG